MPAPSYALYPGAATYPGATSYPGSLITTPILHAFIDLSGSPSGTPNWSSLSDSRVRAFNTSRGRGAEWTEIDAGTASLLVDNRDRAFDPTFATSPYYPYIRPMTRFWLQVELSGTIYNLLKGYATSFLDTYPGGGWSDAECLVELVDEFAVLALDAVPTTSPVRDNYEDVIGSDLPAGYWRLNEDPTAFVQSAEITEPNPFAVLHAPPTPTHGKGWN